MRTLETEKRLALKMPLKAARETRAAEVGLFGKSIRTAERPQLFGGRDKQERRASLRGVTQRDIPPGTTRALFRRKPWEPTWGEIFKDIFGSIFILLRVIFELIAAHLIVLLGGVGVATMMFGLKSIEVAVSLITSLVSWLGFQMPAWFSSLTSLALADLSGGLITGAVLIGAALLLLAIARKLAMKD